MKNVHIIFSYDGSNFLGYQIQNEARTVQYELVKAIEKINGEKTKVDASGRTDKGVHAIEQHACFKSNRNMQESEFKKALNGLLPDDIVIKDVLFEDDDFADGSGGHCDGFEAMRNCGLYDTITYHIMEEDIVGILLDHFTPNDVDEFLEFVNTHEQELTKAILEYE